MFAWGLSLRSFLMLLFYAAGCCSHAQVSWDGTSQGRSRKEWWAPTWSDAGQKGQTRVGNAAAGMSGEAQDAGGREGCEQRAGEGYQEQVWISSCMRALICGLCVSVLKIRSWMDWLVRVWMYGYLCDCDWGRELLIMCVSIHSSALPSFDDMQHTWTYLNHEVTSQTYMNWLGKVLKKVLKCIAMLISIFGIDVKYLQREDGSRSSRKRSRRRVSEERESRAGQRQGRSTGSPRTRHACVCVILCGYFWFLSCELTFVVPRPARDGKCSFVYSLKNERWDVFHCAIYIKERWTLFFWRARDAWSSFSIPFIGQEMSDPLFAFLSQDKRWFFILCVVRLF